VDDTGDVFGEAAELAMAEPRPSTVRRPRMDARASAGSAVGRFVEEIEMGTTSQAGARE